MRHFFIKLGTAVLLSSGLNCHAQTDKWQQLNSTPRYKVAYNEQSVLKTHRGQMKIRIRFIPRGEAERRSTAAEFKEKRYRSHLKIYTIDCNDQTSLLEMIEIFGSSNKRLKNHPGDAQPEPILPGTILDTVAQQICQPLGDDTEENVQLEPDRAEESNLLMSRGLSSDKIEHIENLLKKTTIEKVSPETWRELGDIYFDTDQPALAIRAYERALALRPNDTNILNDQGAMYRQTGDFQRALANFEKASSLDPSNLESIYNSGYVYAFDLGNFQKALIHWRRYLEIDSSSETAKQVQSLIEQYDKQPQQ